MSPRLQPTISAMCGWVGGWVGGWVCVGVVGRGRKLFVGGCGVEVGVGVDEHVTCMCAYDV